MSRKSSGNVEDIYLLSPLQEGLLFHSLYSPETDAYLQQLRFSIRGRLDVAAFERAWQRVVERHPILRTGFVWERQEKPLQVVRRSVKLPWTELDWRALAPQEQQESFAALLEEDRRRSFDFSKAPLLRMTVVRMTDDAYELFCTLHHLLTDGWSTSILIKEIFAFYNAAAEGTEPQLNSPRPYREYIEWLGRQDMAEAAQFWRKLLAGFNAPTPLIADSTPTPPPAAEAGTEIQRAWLSPSTTERLQALARQNGVTLNTIVLGAWSLLLSRYSGEPDVVFGVTISGRPASLAGVEEMVGCFINTLPMRVELPPGARLLPWLSELQLRLLEICEHEYSPLVQVHGYSDVPRGVPLFESMLVFENYPLEATAQELSRRLESVAVHSVERSNFPLGLVAAPGAKLYLQLGYDPGRFSFDTAGRMLAHLEAVLEHMAANPDARLADMSLLTAAERYQLLNTWSTTQRKTTDEAADEETDEETSAGVAATCLHKLFEEQVERAPEGIAVVCGNERLTYRELNRRANQLARYLRDRGIGAERRAGICVERSAEMIVGLLGILKAGGAYVPLDPSNPADRLAYMIEDAQVSVLLTQESLVKSLPPHATPEVVVRLDADWELIAAAPEHNLPAQISPDNTAYVIYTSGSTGQPKGVLVPHRGICNTLLWRREAFSLGSADRILQNLSFAFDASVWQIFGALISGAQLILTHPEDHRDSAYLVKMIREHDITITDFPPSLLKVFLSESGVEQCRSLRHVFCGGEAMTKELQEQFFAQLTADLHNVYGPTETSVDATCWTCRRDDERQLIPIGRPIFNKQMYVLDAQLQPVPVGVSGELYIGGAGMAHGYVRRPAATAEKFIPHPFSPEPGARLYRTGDVGRYLPDGAIQFVGRNDQQVKVRGFRIELGEIEAALAEHPAVSESVVITREDAAGNRSLVAYAVADAAAVAAVTPGVLRNYLKEKLPEYMCPSAFVLLESLPLNANGKVDRRQLPAPAEADWEQPENFVRPRTLVEELLAGIWAQALGIKRVGVNDNFFELGGHSLLATRIISKARGAFQVELPLRALFEKPTVAGLSVAVEAAMKGEQGTTPTPPLTPAPRDGGELPMSFAQQRLWFLDRLVPGNAFYNLHEAYRIAGQLDVAAFGAALEEIVRRHEILRTTLREDEGRLLQIISPASELSLLPVVSLEDLPTASERRQEAARLAREDAQRPFNLSEGPLLRTTLVRLGAEEHWLILTMHHIITDGWSMGILLRELIALYQANAAGKPSPLPELAVQYADFAAWQQNWLRDEALETELSYWREQLDAAPPALVLPTDRPRPATQSFSGATHRFQLAEPLWRELLALSRREGATLFMTLLAAFDTLLWRYSGQDDLLVGTPVANRTRVEVENLIGFFVNTLVLRARLAPGLSFRQLVRQVREVCLGAYAHQDVPFEKLVEELQPERSLSHHPLFQVMFTADHVPAQQPEFDGLTLNLVRTNDETAKFDLTLSLAESEHGLSGAIEYNTDLFDASTVARMSGHFRQLLESIVKNPDLPVSRLALLAEDEQRQLLIEWNDTATPYAAEPCVHQLFQAQAARTPEQIAVISDDEQLSYAELDARSDKLAGYLRELGVAPEVAVGLCLPRSAGMVVALLGILKAGGVYVPLDPQHPRERLAFMLADADAPVLLTQQTLAHLFDADARKVVCLDTERDHIERDKIERGGGESPRREPSPDNAAYIIYTSGSTGRPKGVPVPHRALVNHNRAVSSYYELDARDRVLQFSSLTFDVAAEELFPTLLCGASIVLRADDVSRSIAEFKRFLRKHRVTVVNLPTPFWHEWMAAMSGGERSLPETLRLAVIGSDRASVEHYLTWQREVGERVRLVNAYGPTEATISATAYTAGRPGDAAAAILDSVPIGRPLANTEIYLFDAQLQPVPIGVAGEIYIGGEGLARGYLQRPELTAERFVPHPFARTAGARLYQTGDIGRYLPDGALKIVGRADEQVKVRGYRIELGEIEAVLSSHEGVHEAVVMVDEDATQDKRIVAYVVPKRAEAVAAARVEVWPSLGEYQVYDELMYYAMTNDEQRTSKYEEALHRLVKGKTVVEVGTGGEAILARLCIAAGARKVYAIEALDEAREAATLLVKSLGLADKIILLGGYSFEVELPETVDVCVSELIGTIGGSEGTVAILNDARRFLKADGQMIPRRCVTKIAAAQLPDAVAASPRFTALSANYAEKIFAQVGHRFDVRACLRNFPTENLLSEAGVFEDLEFGGYVAPDDAHDIVLKVTRKGRLDGFLLWLNLHVIEDVVIDNLSADSNCLPVYFPVFEPGIEVEEGDIMRAVCSTSLSDNGVNPDYEIAGKLVRRDGTVVPFAHSSPHHAPGYGQTEFYQRLFAADPTVAASGEARGLMAEKLRAYLAERVPAYMLPSAFVWLDEMPLTSNGKVNRRALPPPNLESAEAGAAFVAPRDFLEQPLIKIWEDVLGVKPIGIADNFFELGGHSLLALRLMGEIQKQFGRELPLAILFEQPTVEHLAKALHQQYETLPHSPLVPLQPEGTKRPLFFVHVGSGQVLCYLELAKQLGTDQPFYGLQDTSLYTPNAPEDCLPDIPIEKMAAYYIESLRAVQPEGPYLLGGWSFGGLVAYEMAVQLAERGEEVPLLFLLDTGTPAFIRELGAEDDTALLGILAREMSLPVTDDDLRPRSPEAQLQYVVVEMERARLIFDDSLAYLRRQLEIFKSRVRVMHAYHPQPYAGRIVFFSASESNLAADTLMPLALNPALDATRGFGKLATGSLELHTVPGTHNQLARGAGAVALAEMLRSRIDREAQAEPSPSVLVSSGV